MTTLIVVRRDANRVFQHFQATLAQTLGDDVELLWDRRAGDRRRPAASVPVERRVQDRRDPEPEPVFLDQRQLERRQRPEARLPDRRRAERRRRTPNAWRVLGFVVVPRDRLGSGGGTA
jgi:hypothetical protein